MSKGFHTVDLHACASAAIPTPAIGQNGNWYVGNDDTGVSAEGAPGPQGVKGETGETGPQGLQGSTGLQGCKGDKGDPGERGPAGSQGIQGAKGDTGATGPMGPQGLKGDTGSQGPTGAVGPKGDTGAKGQDVDVSRIEQLEEDVSKLNSDLDYSETEKQTHTKWIDNKAIYQRTLVIPCQIGSTSYAIDWLPGTDMIVRLDGVYSTPGWTTAQDSYASATDYTQTYISKTGNAVVIKATAKGTLYLTIWYTLK